MKSKITAFLLLLLPMLANAETTPTSGGTLIVSLGDLERGQSLPKINVYIENFYIWSLSIAAALALLMIVVGALQYTLAAGSIGSKDEAKDRIKGAIFGLILLLGAVTILTTLNPGSTTLKSGALSLENNIEIQDANSGREYLEEYEYEDPLLTSATPATFLDENPSEFEATVANLHTARRSLGAMAKQIGGTVSQEEFDAAVKKVFDDFNSYYSSQKYLDWLRDNDIPEALRFSAFQEWFSTATSDAREEIGPNNGIIYFYTRQLEVWDSEAMRGLPQSAPWTYNAREWLKNN